MKKNVSLCFPIITMAFLDRVLSFFVPVEAEINILLCLFFPFFRVLSYATTVRAVDRQLASFVQCHLHLLFCTDYSE